MGRNGRTGSIVSASMVIRLPSYRRHLEALVGYLLIRYSGEHGDTPLLEPGKEPVLPLGNQPFAEILIRINDSHLSPPFDKELRELTTRYSAANDDYPFPYRHPYFGKRPQHTGTETRQKDLQHTVKTRTRYHIGPVRTRYRQRTGYASDSENNDIRLQLIDQRNIENLSLSSQ